MEVPWRKEYEREAGASTRRLAWPGKLVPGSRLDREGILNLPGPWAVPKEEAQKGGKQSKAEERAGEKQPGGEGGHSCHSCPGWRGGPEPEGCAGDKEAVRSEKGREDGVGADALAR